MSDEVFEEDMGDEHMDVDDHGGMDTSALLAAAEEDQMHVRASWHLIPKEVFAFLFANCLMFTGALVAWSRSLPDAAARPYEHVMGTDTIRGAMILALAIYGFWTAVFNIWGRQLKVWPYVVNALLALWVGIGGIMAGLGSDKWDAAVEARKAEMGELGISKTMLDDWMLAFGGIPPAAWVLTAGGLIVMIIVVKGVLGGAKAAKAGAADADDEPAGARRRRR